MESYVPYIYFFPSIGSTYVIQNFFYYIKGHDEKYQYISLFPDHGERIVSQYMQVGEILPNCGLDYVCPHDHFPVHIYSGKSKDDMPKICVSGK